MTCKLCVVQLREAGQVEVDTAEMRRVRARLAARAEAEEELMARCFLSASSQNIRVQMGLARGVSPQQSSGLLRRNLGMW